MRLAVIGTSGSGKSTFAREISELLEIPYIEQDNLFWLPGWKTRPRDDYGKLLLPKINEDNWTICGNHSSYQEEILNNATHIIWLDYSFTIVFLRALRRTIRRVFLREECCNGNIETFKHSFLSRNSILWWVAKTYIKRKHNYKLLFKVKRNKNADYIRFSSPQEARCWAASLQGSIK